MTSTTKPTSPGAGMSATLGVVAVIALLALGRWELLALFALAAAQLASGVMLGNRRHRMASRALCGTGAAIVAYLLLSLFLELHSAVSQLAIFGH